MKKQPVLCEYSGVSLPTACDEKNVTVYRLLPSNPDKAYYLERTDRNIGWITSEEQEILRNSVVGIAGTGGMGGLLGSILVRAGIGEVRISDSEKFDVSNINRQFAATRQSVGVSKAIETARMIREISDDTTLVVYPQGITEETVDHFVKGCNVICDEIEVLALDGRILLHQQGRAHGVPIFNCNTVGFSTNLFLYTPNGMTIEEATGISYTKACKLCLVSRGKFGSEVETRDSVARIANAMMRAVVPVLPEYRMDIKDTDQVVFYHRFFSQQKVPIIATNPPMAAGFLANRVLLYLLKDSPVQRSIVETPEMPGYLHFDAASMQVTVNTSKRETK